MTPAQFIKQKKLNDELSIIYAMLNKKYRRKK